MTTTNDQPPSQPLPEPEPLPPPAWKPPEPRQLPALRAHLIDHLHDPVEMAQQAILLANGQGTVNPDPTNPERAARVLIADETRRLQAAPLYSVTGQMTAFAREAGAKLPGWNVRRQDLPSTSGFMVFGEPMGYYIKANDDNINAIHGRPLTVAIVAVSWGPTAIGNDDNLWLTFWSATDFPRQIDVYRHLGMSPEDARHATYQQRAELTWDNEVVLNFNAEGFKIYEHWTPVDVAEEQLASETTAPWVNTVRAAWLLMKQPKMTETDQVPQPKTVVRRTAARLNLDTSPVRVIHLHSTRRRRTGAGPAEGYKHSVQYPVGGHWRQQYYPSRDTHERIWIDDHIRGPEDAPFRVGKRYTVRVLNRPPRA